MTRSEYLDKLRSELKKNNVADMGDIISEYEQHFAFKLADGYAEEEIAARLGDPEVIASQFDSAKSEAGKGAGFFIKLGLGCTALFEVLFYTLFFAWDLVMAGAAAVFAVLGFCLVFAMNISGLIPYMPYLGSLLLGLSAIGLAGVFGTATVYFFAFLKQMIRASARWHKNVVSGNTLPPLPFHPRFEPKTKRILRNILLWSVLMFGIFFVIAFTVMALQAGALGFWHYWNWFVR
ncbi:MAG: DUF1700 domain-containing protein [Oscillospiraceae bacterium]|nr:DUF1700 domain-containing protein [Oscillospiraceae bacterium]